MPEDVSPAAVIWKAGKQFPLWMKAASILSGQPEKMLADISDRYLFFRQLLNYHVGAFIDIPTAECYD